MTKQLYFLTEISINDFDVNAVPVLGRFKLVSRCMDQLQRGSAEVLQAVSALENNDQRRAIKGLEHLLKLAQLGKPFNQLADSKSVHEAFDPFYCDATKRNETVWRYRHGDIRILFYYAAEKVVLLAHTLPKRSDKLSEKDKNIARQAVIDFLTATRSKAGLQWIK
jgi:mRNA-degrading endonuclease RelE of RelBE toxin-antitoxin system